MRLTSHGQVTRRQFANFVCGAAAATTLGFSPEAASQTVGWTSERQAQYAAYMATFVRSYNKEVDCADLALIGLVRFANEANLPIRLFDYELRPKRWFTFSPTSDDASTFAAIVTTELGAINVIENSVPIPLSKAQAGDLIMSENTASGSHTGHTRIITQVTPEGDDMRVEWYQGTLPPAIPAKRLELFQNIPGVYKDKPRRWNFHQFSS